MVSTLTKTKKLSIMKQTVNTLSGTVATQQWDSEILIKNL